MQYNLFPQRKKFRLSATSVIVSINVFLFIVFSILMSINKNWILYIGLQPASILQGKYIWTIITSMFVHEPFPNITHILFNMISLFFVGTFLEKILGKKRLVGAYLASGIFAGIVFALLAGLLGDTFIGGKLFGDPSVIGIGASGAIFGLVGVLAVLTPRNKISLIAGPLIAIILEYFLSSAFPNAAFLSALAWILNIYVFASIFLMFSFNPKLSRFAVPIQMPFWLLPIVAIVPLVVIGFFIELPIGNSAHFGGLVAGLAYGFYLRHKFPRKTKMISKMFSK